MDHTPEQVNVPVDTYLLAQGDQVLCARLDGSFALCISDEVHDAGAVIHVQAGRPGLTGQPPDLTDNTLSTDLLLLDRCLRDLRQVEPRARNWQARFVAHALPSAGGFERLTALQAFVEVYLEDAHVRLTSAAMQEGPAHLLRFCPALHSLRCEVEADDPTRRMTLPP